MRNYIVMLRRQFIKGHCARSFGRTEALSGLWYIAAIAMAMMLFGCASQSASSMSEDVISVTDRCTVTTDSIVDAQQVLSVLSPTEIVCHQRGDTTITSRWRIAGPNTDFPELISDYPLLDALYNASIASIASANGKRGSSSTDASPSLTAYSTSLSLAYIYPQLAMDRLTMHVRDDRVVEKSGTGGSWPVVADRIAWVVAAWDVYKATGDRSWLGYMYDVSRNTIEDDRLVLYDNTTGLMHGEVSLSDRQQWPYPQWMSPKDIYESTSLSTNVLFANAFYILSDAAEELGVETDYYSSARRLKDAINQNFWDESHGRYASYLYGGWMGIKSPITDNLGQAMCVLCNIADDGRDETLIQKAPLPPYGVWRTYPLPTEAATEAVKSEMQEPSQIQAGENDVEPMSPVTQAFWNLAAARVENEAALRHGLGAIYHAMAQDLTGGGTPDLVEASANVAMIFRVFVGMEFKERGIEFNPLVPVCFDGKLSILGFKYRDAVIDIIIEGCGDVIEHISIDGATSDDNFFPAHLKGEHRVEIKMKRSGRLSQKVTFTDRETRVPPTPIVSRGAGMDTVVNISEGLKYTRIINGRSAPLSADTIFSAPERKTFSSAAVSATSGDIAGFISQPIESSPHDDICIIECETFAKSGSRYIEGKQGRNFVELTVDNNTDLSFPLIIDKAGVYYIDVLYANGNGPVDGGDKCAVRMLTVNSHLQGAVVMPQRGDGNWLDTGYSNRLRVELLSGKNIIQLVYFEPATRNMNVRDNTVLIDHIRVIKR